jgi:hypothetical protein
MDDAGTWHGSVQVDDDGSWAEGNWNVIEFSGIHMCWTMNAFTHRTNLDKSFG